MVGVVADKVLVELEARVADHDRKIADSERKFTRSMAGIQNSAGRAQAFVSGAMRGLAGAVASVGVGALVAGFIQVADQAKKIDAQLRLATSTFGAFGKAQEDVRRIADATRSGLAETANLYGNFTRNAKELGATQADAARATETFTKTLKISGAGTAETASATLQFGQALAAGALRGDELNSILEASPRLSRLLADSLGVSVGQLKALGEAGQLTSDKLLKALTDQKFTRGIDQEFQQLPVTFDEAMTKLNNSAIITFGAFDKGGDFSTALANFVSGGAEGFAGLERNATEFGISVRGTLEGLGDAFTPLINAGLAAFEQLGIGLSNFSADGRKEISGLLSAVDSLLNIGPSIANVFGANGRYDSKLQANFDQGANNSDRARRAAILDRSVNDRFGLGSGSLSDFFAKSSPSARGSSRVASSAGKAKKPRAGASAPKSPLDPNAFDREESDLNDAILRAKQDQATSAAEKAQLEMQRIEASRVQYSDEVKANSKFTEAQRAQLIALSDTLAAVQGVKVANEERRRLAVEQLDAERAGYRREADSLSLKADLARTAKDRRALELQILDLQTKEEDARLRILEASDDLAVAAQARADREALNRDRPLAEQGVKNRTQGPLESYFDRIPKTAAEINEALQNVAVDGIQKMEDGFARAATKALGLKGALGEVVEQLIKLAIQQAELAASSGGGGIGGFIAGIGQLFGGGKATGGPVSAGTTYLVGERGPELLRMGNQGGVVVPNHALRGGGGGPTIVQHVTVDARNSVNPDGFENRIMRNVNGVATRAAAGSFAASQRSAPGTLAQYQKLEG